MLIVCPSCASEYTIDPAKLGADGRTLRCATCRETWFVAAPGAASRQAAPAEEAPREKLGATLLPPARKDSVGKRARRRWLAPAGVAAAVLLLAASFMAGDGVPSARALIAPWLGAGESAVAFRDVASEVVGPADARVLLVGGEIANAGSQNVALRPLEFLVHNGDEQVLATWTEAPPQPHLAPGETVRFTARLASPPMDGRQVRVNFAKSGGIAVAAR